MMGTFRVTIELGDHSGSRLREVSAVVDTGASHAALPSSLKRELGMDPTAQRLIPAPGLPMTSDRGPQSEISPQACT